VCVRVCVSQVSAASNAGAFTLMYAAQVNVCVVSVCARCVSSCVRVCVCACTHERDSVCVSMYHVYYGVATISRLLKITGLFCRISSLL